jgi:thiamine biosynthesis lipoprotein ApbE
MVGVATPKTRVCWEAFATTVVLEQLPGPASIEAAEQAVRAELDAIDEACSRFRPDSELSRLNGRAGRPTALGPLLFEALELALRAAALTDGAVDPTIGESLRLAGYDRDWALLQSEAGESPTAMPEIRLRRMAGWRAVSLDPESRTVMIPAGISVDLGATAKAWAADRAVAAARGAGARGALVAIGGDLAVSGEAPAGGWLVRVTDDHRGPLDAPGQTIRLTVGGLATSSTTVRRWRHRGEEMHHIIDPATGAPARAPWRTASVAAATCADANIAATAALVKRAGAPEWLRGQRLPARLVAHDGQVLCLAGWPESTEVAA